MITDLEDFRIRRRDADGALIEAGFAWYEQRPFWVWARVATQVVLGFVACIPLLVLVLSPYKLVPAIFGVACIAAIRLLSRVPPQILVYRRQLTFHADGAAYYTYGCPWFGGVTSSRMPAPHSAIASIESRSFGLTCGVGAYYRSGELQPLTINQPYEEVARLIAVQLTLALEELRAATEGPRGPQSRPVSID